MLPRNRKKKKKNKPTNQLISPPWSPSRIWSHITEGLLKLEIPDHLIWLSVTLPLVPEGQGLVPSGNRDFHPQEWWNSGPDTCPWQHWAAPVQQPHIRFSQAWAPTRQQRVGGRMRVLQASADFPQYLVSIPSHTLHFWAFMGMLAQIAPLLEPLLARGGAASPQSNYHVAVTQCPSLSSPRAQL